jgi:glycosyltransferase involved in cell wall biosynthesis
MMNDKLRILVVAYYFPPLNSTASHRPYSWAAAWAGAGHEVHVLTTEKYAFDGTLDLDYDLSAFQVHTVGYMSRAPRAGASRHIANATHTAQQWDRFKLATRRLRLGLGMYAEIAWFAYRGLLARALDLARQHRFDFVITTSPPEVVHFVGHALQRKAGIPWVADYRDLWFAEMRVGQFRASSWLTGRIKRPRLREAHALSTVSEGLAERLRRFVGRDAIVCYNGFMPEAHAACAPPRPWSDDKRHVVYTGRMFPDKRDPRRFFEGLAEALRSDDRLNDRLVVDLYGFDDPWIRAVAAECGVAHCVQPHGLVPHRTSLAAQRHADLLLFLDWMDARAEGILTGKLFEYLAAERPILGVGLSRNTEAARIITEAHAGETLIEPHEIRDRLLALVTATHPAQSVRLESIQRFSRLRQADELLTRILAGLEERAA